ncbi:hypothetical protein Tco_0545880 [Tanacetum coccineum]
MIKDTLRPIKKKTETKSPAVSLPQLKKKVDLSAEQLLLTVMDEVKSLKEQIKVPSNNSPSVSQNWDLSLQKGNKPPGLTKATIFNQNDEVVLISLRRKDVYVIHIISMVRDSETALAHECLYVNFLSEMEPKKLIDALEEEGWVIVRQEELNQFEKRNKD